MFTERTNGTEWYSSVRTTLRDHIWQDLWPRVLSQPHTWALGLYESVCDTPFSPPPFSSLLSFYFCRNVQRRRRRCSPTFRRGRREPIGRMSSDEKQRPINFDCHIMEAVRSIVFMLISPYDAHSNRHHDSSLHAAAVYLPLRRELVWLNLQLTFYRAGVGVCSDGEHL